jgi:hypothetical protein
MPMAAWVLSEIPLITDEEWEALNKEEDE